MATTLRNASYRIHLRLQLFIDGQAKFEHEVVRHIPPHRAIDGAPTQCLLANADLIEALFAWHSPEPKVELEP